jgi:glycosyltransferase involved in cell wall biosynthesis
MTAHTFYPESKGGVENHILGLAHYLRGLGHEAAVFYRIHSPDYQQYQLIKGEWEGIPIFKIVHNYIPQRPNPYPFYDRQVEVRFLDVIDQFAPDLVHIHHLGTLSTSLIGAAQRQDLPVIYTLHDFWPMCRLSQMLTPDGRLCPGPDGGMRCTECMWLQAEDGPPQTLNIRDRIRKLGLAESLRRAPRFARDWVAARFGAPQGSLWTRMLTLPARDQHMRQTLLEADLLLSPSRFLIEMFDKWGVPSSRFAYVQNGIHAGLLSAPRVDGYPKREPFTFGFIGSHNHHKGVHILIEAFAHAELSDAALRIWGGANSPRAAEYVASLKQAADAHENISLEGQFSPERITEVLREIDVLVIPSLWYENNPLTIMEAFAMGVPVIAGNVGGMAELVIDDENGLLFDVGNPNDLADKMARVLDPALLAQYRKGIKAPHSVEEMSARILHIYEDILAKKAGI